MAFRRRNVNVTSAANLAVNSAEPASAHTTSAQPRGTRPSPITGKLTISTGAGSLDGQLAGHSGLALGSSLLIEESGNTDYAGVLVKYFAAEGVLQGHVVHVLGVGPQWGRSLPGLASEKSGHGASAAQDAKGVESERMKIAWRYERLGESGAARGAGERAGARDSTATLQAQGLSNDVFCHAFDLAKKLTGAAIADIKYYSAANAANKSPFADVLRSLSRQLAATAAQGSIHRLVIPSLLSPASYPPHACEPQHLISFAHSLRSLLRQYSQRLAVMITLPLDLYSRDSGLVRWLEILSDGVCELTPFAHASDDLTALSTSGAATAQEDQPQGMFKLHKLPVFHERSGGGGGLKGLGDDLAFTLSRRKFLIRAFSLPPAEGDTEAQQAATGKDGPGKFTKEQIDF